MSPILPSSEIKLLAETLARFLQDQNPFPAQARRSERERGWNDGIWQGLARLGIFESLLSPLNDELGPLAGLTIFEASGRALLREPLLASLVLGAGAIELGGTEEQRRTLLPRLAGGELVLGFAHYEAQSRYSLSDVGTRAAADGDGWLLDGEKFLVLQGDRADALIVSAKIGDRHETEIALFLVEMDAQGVRRQSYRTQDGHSAANVSLCSVAVAKEARLSGDRDGLGVVEAVVDRAIAALCAEAAGLIGVMIELTVDYLKLRKQFGVPIGTFQALQHRAAEMVVAHDQAKSMALSAAFAARSPDRLERRREISAAKFQIGKSLRLVAQQAVHLHGGTGISAEHKISHCFARATAIEYLFGDCDHHLQVVLDLGGLIPLHSDRLARC